MVTVLLIAAIVLLGVCVAALVILYRFVRKFAEHNIKFVEQFKELNAKYTRLMLKSMRYNVAASQKILKGKKPEIFLKSGGLGMGGNF